MDGMEVTEKNLVILSAVVKCSLNLKLTEVKSAVQYCFPNITDKNLIRHIVQFLRSVGDNFVIKGTKTKKYPIILVIHDVSIIIIIFSCNTPAFL